MLIFDRRCREGQEFASPASRLTPRLTAVSPSQQAAPVVFPAIPECRIQINGQCAAIIVKTGAFPPRGTELPVGSADLGFEIPGWPKLSGDLLEENRRQTTGAVYAGVFVGGVSYGR